MPSTPASRIRARINEVAADVRRHRAAARAIATPTVEWLRQPGYVDPCSDPAVLSALAAQADADAHALRSLAAALHAAADAAREAASA